MEMERWKGELTNTWYFFSMEEPRFNYSLICYTRHEFLHRVVNELPSKLGELITFFIIKRRLHQSRGSAAFCRLLRNELAIIRCISMLANNTAHTQIADQHFE